MTHEEELIELLYKETTAEDYNASDLSCQREIIERTFREFGLQGKITRAYCAPQVNCFDFEIGADEKLQSYREIEKNLQMALKETNVRIVLPKSEVGIACYMEVPTKCRMTVSAGTLFRSYEWCESKARLPLMLGKSIDNEIEILDLASAPHLLMAGCTGSCKSVLMDLCLLSLMLRHTPNEMKLILVDPKVVEFQKYEHSPYLQFPIINSPEDTLSVLNWLWGEMDRRYGQLAEAGCRNIRDFNEKEPGSMPYIVMFINEIADVTLVSKSQVESYLSRLAAMARAVGIHLVISTSRLDSITLKPTILANLPVRILFHTINSIDSKRIIGSNIAVYLLGCDDMIFTHGGLNETRIQGGYVNDDESVRILTSLKVLYKDIKPIALASMGDLASDK